MSINIETFNNVYYSLISKYRTAVTNRAYSGTLLGNLNFFKIGLIYGLIVDAFKLGS